MELQGGEDESTAGQSGFRGIVGSEHRDIRGACVVDA